MMSCSVNVVMGQTGFLKRKGRKRVEWIKDDKRQRRQNHKNHTGNNCVNVDQNGL